MAKRNGLLVPAWSPALVFALALVGAASLTLLIWTIAYIIPAMRAAAGGVS